MMENWYCIFRESQSGQGGSVIVFCLSHRKYGEYTVGIGGFGQRGTAAIKNHIDKCKPICYDKDEIKTRIGFLLEE